MRLRWAAKGSIYVRDDSVKFKAGEQNSKGLIRFIGAEIGRRYSEEDSRQDSITGLLALSGDVGPRSEDMRGACNLDFD